MLTILISPLVVHLISDGSIACKKGALEKYNESASLKEIWSFAKQRFSCEFGARDVYSACVLAVAGKYFSHDERYSEATDPALKAKRPVRIVK